MKGFRTVVFNGALALIPIVDLIANNGALVSGFLGPNAAAILSAVGLANMVLRWVTTTPIFQPEVEQKD